jgi:hypothetical protein
MASGKVNININDVSGEFFPTYSGMRQGDPISPIMFNAIVDAMCHGQESTSRGSD